MSKAWQTSGGLTSKVILDVLAKAAACPEQHSFFEAFVALVFQRVEQERDQFGALFFVAGDLSRLELEVIAKQTLLLDLAENFLKECGIPSANAQGPAKFQRAAQGLRLERVSLWCRLKGIGTSKPLVDLGFSLPHVTETADVVPQCEDLRGLNRHAQDECSKMLTCGASLLPSDARSPPGIVEFNIVTASSSKLLLSGLTFFKEMGLPKPDDAIIRQLSACKAKSCIVRAHIAADGLTQLSLRLFGSVKLPSERTSVVLGYRKEAFSELTSLFGRSPDVLEFATDGRGCSLALGYCCLGS